MRSFWIHSRVEQCAGAGVLKNIYLQFNVRNNRKGISSKHRSPYRMWNKTARLWRTDEKWRMTKPNFCDNSDHNESWLHTQSMCRHTPWLMLAVCVIVCPTARFQLDQDRWGAQCLCPSATERIWKGKYFDVCSRDRHQWRWHCHQWLWDNAKWELAHKMHKLHLSSVH